MRRWFERIPMQNWIAVGQLVIAVLMLWSLRQSARSLDLSRQQIESAKAPVIEVSSFSDEKMHLLNIGGAEAKNFQVVAYLAAYYREKSEEVTRYQLSTTPPRVEVIKASLPTGEEFAVDFQKLTFVNVGQSAEPDEREAFATVFRFYRASDMRPFYKIVPFIRAGSEDSATNTYLYFPLALIPGSAVAGPNRPVFKKLRETLRAICIENLDLAIDVRTDH